MTVSRRHLLGVICLTLVLCTVSTAWLTSAPLEGPTASDRQVVRSIKTLMENQHLSQHPLDDEISERAMEAFLDGFDYRKMYFYQSDIDEFRQKERELDDDVRFGVLTFAYKVFNRFQQRVGERLQMIEELVGSDFDFSVDEYLIKDADDLSYPKDEAEARDRWRKLIKLNLLTYKADGELSDEEAREKIRKKYRTLAKRYGQMDGNELLESFMTAITSSYDPHSEYMRRSAHESFEILMRLNLEGIGAALKLGEEGLTTVTRVIPGGAADKDGRLKEGDQIVSVGQGPTGELVDVEDMKLDDVVDLIRGKKGTVVRLGVVSAGSTETKIYDLRRARVELEEAAAQSKIIPHGKKLTGEPWKVGIIDLPSFYRDMAAARLGRQGADFRSSTRDCRRILQQFKSDNVDVVVLDLRQNGGGSLEEAIDLTGLFIDTGTVVQVKDSTGRLEAHRDLQPGMAWEGPLVVLTSKFSASASEILAGAIQDYDRGLVIGDESTHGKGTVQSLMELGNQIFRIRNAPQLGALKITMQQFYRPNGDSTQKRGVIPDVILPSMTNHIGVGEADLDYAVEFDKIRPAAYRPYNYVSGDMVANLKANSSNRVAASEGFTKENNRIERYKKLKDEKQIPLQESKYMARREAERDAEEEEEKQFEEQQGEGDQEIFKDNFYNEEILDITVDYVSMLAQRRVARNN